jgi:serine/threonine-protein kinase
MADVLLAMIAGPHGSGFAKLAVLKKLRANLAEDPEFIAMLVDEARISARLNHPNVIQTMEVGVEGGEYFLAMEYLDGQPLHRIQRRVTRSGTTWPKALDYLIVADTLAGLHHAHELADYDGTPLDVVHRDVTPQNVFVTYDGQVKVVDFGIAKAVGRAAETKQGIVKGKVRYMSPEQAMGQPVDRRSDIFAAGILLWEAATGQHLWSQMDDVAILCSLIEGDYRASPRTIVPEVPEELDRICRKALAREPNDRYATAAHFRADLEAFLGDGIVAARRELGPLVAEMFTKQRRELRALIEAVGKTSLTPMSMASLEAARSESVTPLAVKAPGSSNAIVLEPASSGSTRRPIEPTAYSFLGFIPRKKRFGAG